MAIIGLNTSRNNNNLWKDVIGVTRDIHDMNSVHLCFVLKQLDISKGQIKRHIKPIEEELKNRIKSGLFERGDYYLALSIISENHIYDFYNDSEQNEKLSKYYEKLISKYVYFDLPIGLF